LILILICLLILWDSSHRLVVTEYHLQYTNLPEAFDGFTLVQLSDLHASEFGEHNSRLVSKVAAVHPDLIALTGDYIESAKDIPITEHLIRQLSDIAPVTFTSGNHDWASGAISELKQAVTDSGGVYLSNEWMAVEQDGQQILLAGVEDPNGRADMIRPDGLLAQINADHPNSFVILQAHRNDFVKKYPVLPCDLVLTGHGHGGVIRLPFVGGLIGTEVNFFPTYDAGLFQSGRYTMVVSRGLGDTPLIPRFLNNPEIVSITLSCKK